MRARRAGLIAWEHLRDDTATAATYTTWAGVEAYLTWPTPLGSLGIIGADQIKKLWELHGAGGASVSAPSQGSKP